MPAPTPIVPATMKTPRSRRRVPRMAFWIPMVLVRLVSNDQPRAGKAWWKTLISTDTAGAAISTNARAQAPQKIRSRRKRRRGTDRPDLYAPAHRQSQVAEAVGEPTPTEVGQHGQDQQHQSHLGEGVHGHAGGVGKGAVEDGRDGGGHGGKGVEDTVGIDVEGVAADDQHGDGLTEGPCPSED